MFTIPSIVFPLISKEAPRRNPKEKTTEVLLFKYGKASFQPLPSGSIYLTGLFAQYTYGLVE